MPLNGFLEFSLGLYFVVKKLSLITFMVDIIALFMVTFSRLLYNVFERGCEAISGNFALFVRSCLTSTFKYIVMQTRKFNCEKGYAGFL